MDNQHPDITTEEQQTPVQAKKDKDTVARYVSAWRSDGLTAGAKTIDEMIAALEDGADVLRVLKEAGVVLDAGTAAGDDACLVTTDTAVAQQYGFTWEAPKQQEARNEVSPGDGT